MEEKEVTFLVKNGHLSKETNQLIMTRYHKRVDYMQIGGSKDFTIAHVNPTAWRHQQRMGPAD